MTPTLQAKRAVARILKSHGLHNRITAQRVSFFADTRVCVTVHDWDPVTINARRGVSGAPLPSAETIINELRAARVAVVSFSVVQRNAQGTDEGMRVS